MNLVNRFGSLEVSHSDNPALQVILAHFQEQMVDMEEELMAGQFADAARRAEMFVAVIRGLGDLVA